jgi:hypothetical protein
VELYLHSLKRLHRVVLTLKKAQGDKLLLTFTVTSYSEGLHGFSQYLKVNAGIYDRALNFNNNYKLPLCFMVQNV